MLSVFRPTCPSEISMRSKFVLRSEMYMACFDAEQYLSQLLDHFKESHQMPQGIYCLADYDLRLGKQGLEEFRQQEFKAGCFKDCSAGGFAAIGIVAVLEVLEAPSALVGRFLELWQNLLETHVVKQFRDRNICVMDNDALLRGKVITNFQS
ncbi:hypothetical protein GUITHDRAFT_106342 [Guillardia theta CCMP2712]|uniref:Uncharacterized protein n=1 Tax=Guillardia theta (strain CCMP2712) TaxID=905079 RepID=L1JH11_GUITC|nr:hypothetical protein GUITHDRAFT_106342 [Guillardia theta CCMP2712]EKX47788.1 hypothetical protein GUITHDRAFT_106342 [Guillardia theta CCMP2712]|eukprot:XP_005834768.1 hypothetical protein GUITHDRAFT_106342 [Guillardia theta CCMP2712]